MQERKIKRTIGGGPGKKQLANANFHREKEKLFRLVILNRIVALALGYRRSVCRDLCL